MKRALAILALWSVSAISLADTFTGKVVGVSDGDTITVLDESRQQIKVRLSGIDAPEKAQPYGQRSRQNLSGLVFGKEVLIDWQKKDRYGRTVGKVLVSAPACSGCEKTTDANLSQISSGMAWWYRQYAKDQSIADRERYATTEEEARIGRVGLWSDQNPVPPWEWRHR